MFVVTEANKEIRFFADVFIVTQWHTEAIVGMDYTQ
jgi:hypothetical protein